MVTALVDLLTDVCVFVFVFVYSDNQNAHTWVVPVLVHLLTGKT